MRGPTPRRKSTAEERPHSLLLEMRILFDTNVLVDATVRGRPYHDEAVFLINEVEQDRLSGVLAPLSIRTLWYLGTEAYDTDPRPLI